jgi:photosystem II stability/assembly factor-like uncharacterized protein
VKLIRALSAVSLLALGLAAAAPAASTPGAAVDPAAYGQMRWRLLGPFRGGWATMVTGVPTQPDTFYFGAAGGGVWKTQDAGRTWTSIFDQGPASIGALAVAPSDPQTIYVGTGQPEPRYDVTAGQGVFKSTDGGKTWASLGLAAAKHIGRIWIDPADAQTVLVAAQGHFFGPNPERGVYRSVDGGKTWSQTLKINDDTGVQEIVSDPANPKILFAAAWQVRQYPWQSYFTPAAGPGSAIYKSVDGGLTWTRLAGGGWPEGSLGRIGLAAAHRPEGTRLYATIDSPTAGGLWRSDDGGDHWAKVNEERAFTSYYSSRLTVEPGNPDVVYTVGQSVRRCVDGGRTCEVIRGSPGGDDYHSIWINPLHPDHIITGSDQGAQVSVDNWATFSDWYNQPTGQFYHLAADNRFPYWVYSGQQDSGTVGIASRTDYGGPGIRDWRPVGGDERDYDIPDPVDPLIVYSSGLGGRVNRWDGHTGQVADISAWPVSSYGQRPTLTKYHFNWVTPLVASNTGPAALYLGAQVLFKTTDQGRHWRVISGDLTGKTDGAQRCGGDVALADAMACGYGNIVAIQPSPRHADEIWVGTDDGLIQLTRDGGAHWTNVTPPAISPWSKIATVEVSALEDGVAYVAVDRQRLDDFQPHVFKTRDYGATWREVDEGLPAGHFVSVVRADPQKAGLLYAGTDETAYVSFDDGEHWSSLRANLPTAWVRDLLVHGDDLVAGTQGRAIWVMDNLATLRQATPATAGETAHLYAPAVALRVHPNNNHDTPPTPETPLGENPPAGAVIDYWLGADLKGPVVLEIRDSAGHLVRRIASDYAPDPAKGNVYFQKAWTRPDPTLAATPGAHRFVWNLRYPRPAAVHYGYSMGITWTEGTHLSPEGPFVLPGTYAVTLKAGGKTLTAPLEVKLDPRIATPAADLAAALAYSQDLDGALFKTYRGYGETTAILKQLDTLAEAAKADPALAAKIAALKARIASPAGGQTFSGLDGAFAYLETDAEGADAAPTAAQLQVVAEKTAALKALQADWDSVKAKDIPALNADLAAAKMSFLTLPGPGAPRAESPDDGDDLP